MGFCLIFMSRGFSVVFYQVFFCVFCFFFQKGFDFFPKGVVFLFEGVWFLFSQWVVGLSS